VKLDDTARNRLLISVSVLDQCNKEQLPKDEYWYRFIHLYNARVGDKSGSEVAALLKNVTQLPA